MLILFLIIFSGRMPQLQHLAHSDTLYMKWIQVTDPFDHIALSALVAVVPIVFLFWALIIKKMKGYQASLFATAIALVIAITIYGMPIDLALLSTGHGVLYGLFPICWIVITAVFLFNITVESGQLQLSDTLWLPLQTIDGCKR